MESQTHLKPRKPVPPFDVLRALKDNIRLFLLTAPLLATVMIAYLLLTNQTYYTANATIIFEKHVPELLYTDPERYIHSFEDWMRTQIHEIEANHVLENAIDRYEQENRRWMRDGESKNIAIARLRGKLQVSQINNTQIMSFAITMRDQESVAPIINSVITSYIQHKDEQRRSLDKTKLSYLMKKKENYEKKLEKSYQELMVVSRKYATAVADEKNLYIYLNMFMDLRAKYNEILLERIETENRLKSLKNKEKNLSSLNHRGLEGNPLLLETEQKIRTQMVGLRENSTEYRRLENLLENIRNKNIQLTHKTILNEIKRDIFESTARYQAAASTEKELKRELQRTQMEVMEFNTAVLRASTKRQEIERLINIWNRINERIEQIQIELFNPGRVKVLNQARTPEFPDANKKNKNIALALLSSIFFGLGIAIGRGFLDKSIKRPADFEKVLGFPPTGIILNIQAERIPLEESYHVLHRYPDSFTAHLYEQLAVYFEKEHNEHNSQIFGIFSLRAKSGGTTTALNSLTALDADPLRKLYLDLNFANPFQQKLPELANRPGLLNRLHYGNYLSNCIQQPPEFPFDMLLPGSSQPNQPGTVRASQLLDLIAELRQCYQYVFLDAPPLLYNPKAHQLAQIMDVVVLVIDFQHNAWADLFRGLALLNRLGIKVVSVVLNNVPLPQSSDLRQEFQIFKDITTFRSNAPNKPGNGSRQGFFSWIR